MEDFRRYAVYFAPEEGPLARFADAWLGWSALTGRELAHPEVEGLPRPVEELTRTPRKYGFHGTLKPPFRLAPGRDAAGLLGDLETLAARLAPVRLSGLALHSLGGFVALTPTGDTAPLARLAGEVVQGLDDYRAPPTPEELARRRAAGLTPRQEELLARWGYPYVMEEFRFHLTLTGALAPDEADQVIRALDPVLTPLLPRPFEVTSLCLFGEADTGRFRLLRRVALSG